VCEPQTGPIPVPRRDWNHEEEDAHRFILTERVWINSLSWRRRGKKANHVMNPRIGTKPLRASCEGYSRCGRLGPFCWPVIRVAFSSNPRVVPLSRERGVAIVPPRGQAQQQVQGDRVRVSVSVCCFFLVFYQSGHNILCHLIYLTRRWIGCRIQIRALIKGAWKPSVRGLF
jgi:hypothetical protein